MTEATLKKIIKITGIIMLVLYGLEIIVCAVLEAKGIMNITWRGLVTLYIVSLPVGACIYSSIYELCEKYSIK